MEGFTTYEFYSETYYGEAIDADAFPHWCLRASDKLRMLTYGNITDETQEMYDEQIQKATCALAEVMYQLDRAAKTASARDDSNVKSKSSGGESVTYGDTDTLITKALADKTVQNRLMHNAIADYLSGTGLLYAGV